jgi:hypothetical protein
LEIDLYRSAGSGEVLLSGEEQISESSASEMAFF